MANLTLVIDDDILQAARIKALQQGTSVNAVCREAIARFVGRTTEPGVESIAALRALARRVKPSHAGTTAWPGRDALYEQAMSERGLDLKPRKR